MALRIPSLSIFGFVLIVTLLVFYFQHTRENYNRRLRKFLIPSIHSGNKKSDEVSNTTLLVGFDRNDNSRAATLREVLSNPSANFTSRWNVTERNMRGNWSANTDVAAFSNYTINLKKMKFLEEPSNICDITVKVLNVVLSGPYNKHKRTLIRKKVNLPPDWRRVFLIGFPVNYATYTTRCDEVNPPCEVNQTALNQLFEESHQYKDLVITDTLDVYQNLTTKSVLMFEFAQSRCIEAYLLKTDDDVIANVPVVDKMYSDWRSRNKTTNSWEGHVMTYPALRDGYRNVVSESAYPNPTYPLYLSGPKYRDVVRLMRDMSERVPFIPIEDVYMGILGRLAGMELTHNTFSVGEGDCDKGFVDIDVKKDLEIFERWKSC